MQTGVPGYGYYPGYYPGYGMPAVDPAAAAAAAAQYGMIPGNPFIPSDPAQLQQYGAALAAAGAPQMPSGLQEDDTKDPNAFEL